MADYTLSLRDEHGDCVEITLTEEQARQFMAGQAIAHWSSTPEEIGVDPDTHRLYERHDAPDHVREDEEESK